MNCRHTARLPILGLLALLSTPTAEARETPQAPEESTAQPSEQSFVYDYKSGTFVHAQHPQSSSYTLKNVQVNVGYDQAIDKTRDSWPITVNRFLYKRPLGQ
jgi:hypothetical protein